MTQPSVPFLVRATSGVLLEARVYSLRTVEEVDAYGAEFARIFATMPRNSRPILCADHRPVAIYPPPVADRLGHLFRNMNTRFDRVAIVVRKTNATLLLQLERIVREVQFTQRRVFHDTAGAIAHLSPGLDPLDVAEVRRFLEEYTAPV